MFTGEYERLLDEKGRLVLPPTFRRHLVNAAFLTKSLEDPCLLVYSEEEIGKAATRLIEQVKKNQVSPHALAILLECISSPYCLIIRESSEIVKPLTISSALRSVAVFILISNGPSERNENPREGVSSW